MMESRKRPFVEEDDQIHSKKRVASLGSASPHNTTSNSHDSVNEPADASQLENFRKEAIYRRMLHYSRENQRSQVRITELERRKSECEAGLAAMAACWNQLTETIRMVVNADSKPSVKQEGADAPLPILAHEVEARMNVTRDLVARLMQLGDGGVTGIAQDAVLEKYQQFQDENTNMRSELSLLRMQSQDLQAQAEDYHEKLVAAEIRLDRLQSSSVAAVRNGPVKTSTAKQESEAATVPSEEKSPSPPETRSLITNGNVKREDSTGPELQTIIEAKEQTIARLQNENNFLRDQVSRLEYQAKIPHEQPALESESYKALLEVASRTKRQLEESQASYKSLNDQMEKVSNEHKKLEESLQSATQTSTAEIRALLAKRDMDLVRLREERDTSRAELLERKQKDSSRTVAAQEYKVIAQSCTDRLAAAHSEVTRLRARLAANTGDADLVKFLFEAEEDANKSYIEQLRNKVKVAETRAESIERSLQLLDKDHPDVAAHLRAETEVRTALASATEELARYRSTFGDLIGLSDPEQLSSRLLEKDQEVQRLRVQIMEHEKSESAVYVELDKLSSAWQQSHEQSMKKIEDIDSWRKQLQKAQSERAKIENKYFAAIRDKEATEQERKSLARSLEKLEKAHEKEVVAHKFTQTLKGQAEQECNHLNELRKLDQENVLDDLAESHAMKEDHEKLQKNFKSVEEILNNRNAELKASQVKLRKNEEQLFIAKKELDRQKSKLEAFTSATSTAREGSLQAHIDKCMRIINCSICGKNPRSTIITKCMHTFCKDCVDARISTRQRKCPACNLAFSQSDAQPLYFQ